MHVYMSSLATASHAMHLFFLAQGLLLAWDGWSVGPREPPNSILLALELQVLCQHTQFFVFTEGGLLNYGCKHFTN